MMIVFFGTLSKERLCFFNYLENETTAAQPISHVVTNTSHAIETSTFLPVGNNTESTEKNHTDTKSQQSNTVNNEIILCIKIFGCVDILLICTYSAMCIYDRQHRILRKANTNGNVPGNNSVYENAEIFFISATGNQLL